MMKNVLCHNITPFTKEQLDTFQSIFSKLSNAQLIWISGYLWGLSCNALVSEGKNIDHTCKSTHIENVGIAKDLQIVIVSASQTGNARKIAEQLRDSFIASNLGIVLFNAADFKFKQISKVKFLIVIISTHGEGDPPEEAILLYKYLFSKRAVRMEDTNFIVFGLGDRSYSNFAQAGRDLDNRLEELGACRLYKRIDADLDFQETADVWIKEIVFLFQEKLSDYFVQKKNNEASNVIFNQKKRIVYCKEFPFFGCLLTRQKITSRLSLKDVHHLEINITNSNLIYWPGDALGVWYENDVHLVHEILELLHLTGDEEVKVKGKLMILSEALRCHYELTKNTPVLIKDMARVTKNQMLLDLLLDSNTEKLKSFFTITPIVEMLRYICVKLSPQDLLQVLRPIQPRFYSISSAQSEVGIEEVHITVGVIRYKFNGRFRTGGASGYLVDRLKENDNVRVFIVSNNNFRLPKNLQTPVIMIGAGTGIAPFRAFMQQRSSDGATGKNWLFFGNLRFVDDFLYQVEWQRYVKEGLLTKINTAWSRDQYHKVYVQDKLLQNSVELWSWIQEGAYVYICGDASRMAIDVEQALVRLTSKLGDMSIEKANEFWDNMRVQRRYQRDIY